MSKLRLTEQLTNCPYIRLGPGTRRQLKRETARKFRRQGKRLGDDAPQKRGYKGWAD